MELLYALISVFIVSLIALIGIFTLGIHRSVLKKVLILFVSFSAGALLGDVFFHLLPEMVHASGWTWVASVGVLGGIVFGLITEKIIRRNHCHMPITKDHKHPFAYMNLIGDMVHNFIDGLIIGASYLISIPVGIATTIAVIFHEIPQEIGDFGVLVHGGFTKRKALLLNFLTALTAFIGVILAFVLYRYIEGSMVFLIPFAAGTFIYVACSDLIPELHKENKLSQNLRQILFFLIGIGLMASLMLIHYHH